MSVGVCLCESSSLSLRKMSTALAARVMDGVIVMIDHIVHVNMSEKEEPDFHISISLK